MTDAPINLSQVRETEPLNLAWTVIHGREVVTIPYDTLLALVEAVQAAHTHARYSSGAPAYSETKQKLRDALARFEFGPRP